MKKYRVSLFIFRRDLRLEDNCGLQAALEQSEHVLPCFIFDPRQIKKNPFYGKAVVQFMVESLLDLDEQLKNKNSHLFIFSGVADQIVSGLIKEEGIQAVFVNRDYTPFSIQRDSAIQEVCDAYKVYFSSSSDCLLNEPQEITKIGGGRYTIYTPFMRTCMSKPVGVPQVSRLQNYFNKSVPLENKEILERIVNDINPSITLKGGRAKAKEILKSMGRFKDYDDSRNIPSLDASTHLSAHHKFGTVSIREVYHAIHKQFGPEHALIKELYWRDFFVHIGFHYPHVLGGCFHKKYDRLSWENNSFKFKAWCEGRTGFPIVDAGMRELNTTGFMHNRLRMITASFLVKDLHIDWQWGEKYFAQKLVDYDPLVNNGNWQWAASTGCDAQPYFRIFNPWLQQKKFDPEAIYIKKWIPELRNYSPQIIHKISEKSLSASQYPKPIVDHSQESKRALAMYKSI